MRPIALLLLSCAIAPASAHDDVQHVGPQHVNRAQEGWPVDDFTLTDQQGKAFTLQRLQGRWTFVTFGDTRCGAPCTAALSAVQGLTQRILRTEAVLSTQVLFVSLDPARDQPPQLRQYLAPYDAHFIGATGSWSTLKRLADDLGAAGDLPQQPAAEPKYRGTLVLVGPDGFVRAEYLPPFDVPYLTADYLKTRVRK